MDLSIDKKAILDWISAIESQISTLHEEFIDHVPKTTKKSLFSIAHYKDEVRKQILSPLFDTEAMILAVDKLSTRSQDMLISIDSDVPVSKNALTAIEKLNDLIVSKSKEIIDTLVPVREDERNHAEHEFSKLASALQIIRQQLNDLQNDNNRSRQEIGKNQKQLEKSQADIMTFDQRLDETLKKSTDQADAILAELFIKQKEIKDLVGLLAGESVSGSYGKSASAEKKTADAMRNGSVGLMLAIVAIIGYSLFETAHPNFEWETALARLVFSITLSVPAAYLARESSKHRVQQYTYQRVALDLQAIPPYLASLPAEDQNRLRGGIAERIFGAKESIINVDSYPLNIQDILMGIINKIDTQKSIGEKK